MMIKRAFAVTIVAFAGILMLINNSFPHHHHGSAICYRISHCHNENSDGNEPNHSSHHEHDGDRSQDVCILGAPVLLPSGLESHECKCITYTYNHSGATNCPAAVFSYVQEKIFPFLFIYDSSSGPRPSYSSIVSSSLGLRAPPAV
jgi:hypothetical protein